MCKIPISAAIITYNEEKNIERTLNQLSWCNEIVIVDSFSNDQTINICKKYTSNIFFKKFEGYGDQKRFLVSKCKNNWILSLDADEVLTEELIKEIQDEFNNGPKYNAYYLNRKHVYLGKIFKYGNLKNDAIIRLFDKNHAYFTNKKVHETILYNGKKGRLKKHFLHYTANSIEQINEKKNRYASLVSDEYFNNKKKVSLFLLVFKYPLAFVKEYIIKGNILNGYEGYVWSTYIAEYSVLKYLKLRERNKQSKLRK